MPISLQILANFPTYWITCKITCVTSGYPSAPHILLMVTHRREAEYWPSNPLLKITFQSKFLSKMINDYKINEIFVHQAEFLCAVDHSCMVSSIKWFHATPDNLTITLIKVDDIIKKIIIMMILIPRQQRHQGTPMCI